MSDRIEAAPERDPLWVACHEPVNGWPLPPWWDGDVAMAWAKDYLAKHSAPPPSTETRPDE